VIDGRHRGRIILAAYLLFCIIYLGAPRLAISNLGAFGVKQFTAIIPPACAAILAIGAIREAAVVRNKQVAVGEICSLTLSADHRIVDGIAAAKFLERMQAHLDSL